MKNTLLEDLQGPLDMIQRGYIRKTVTIILTPIIIIGGAYCGAKDFVIEWYKACW